MCNIVDGKCELAGRYPDNPYHNSPDLYHQIHAELIHLHSATKVLDSINDLNYGYKIAAIRKSHTKKIIAICEAMLQETNPNEAA